MLKDDLSIMKMIGSVNIAQGSLIKIIEQIAYETEASFKIVSFQKQTL